MRINGSGIVNNSSNPPTFTTGFSGTMYFDSGTAGDSAINVSTGGNLFLDLNSTADSATITIADGGRAFFFQMSTGGSARVINIGPGGILDISALSSAIAGITFGSIEGGGLFELGGKVLTVGLNNSDTTVSGTIVDDGVFAASGGVLLRRAAHSSRSARVG